MPIYDFLCRECEHRFDDLVSADAVDRAACPQCTSGDVVKLYAPFAVHTSGDAGGMPLPASCAAPAGGARSGGCCGGGCGGCG